MTIEINLLKNIVNLTTTTLTDGYDSTQSTNDDDLKNILTYTIPLSCLTIILVVLILVGIRQRHRVLDKWTSLKRMRNTNPRFLQSTVLRRDSEFDSYNQAHVQSTELHHEKSKERQYRLEMIT